MRLRAWIACVMVLIHGGPAGASTASVDGAARSRSTASPVVDEVVRPWPPRTSDFPLVQLDDAPARGEAVDARIAALEAERDAISTRGPRIGMITGLSIAGVAGTVALVCGIVTAHASGNCTGDGSAVGGPSTTGVSLTVMLAGLGLTALSGGVYLGRKSRRNRLDREIRELRGAAGSTSAPAVSIGIDRDGGGQLRLGWRF